MARLFAAADSITIPQDFSTGGVVSFRMRTTQTTTNAELVSHHSPTASVQGYGVTINNGAFTPGKLCVTGKSGAAIAFNIASVTNVNDGNWHHIGINLWYSGLANGNQLFVDGALEAQADAGGFWGGATDPFRLGKSNDTFWAGYVGELAEVAVWAGGGTSLRFTPEQFAALAKGYAPDAVWRGGSAGALHIYMPLDRTVQCKLSEQGTPTVSGTSVTDHPPAIGSSGP